MFVTKLVKWRKSHDSISRQRLFKLNYSDNDPIKEPTIKNLVFRGGGPRGIAYVGALQELEKTIGAAFSKIERVAGTSAGAITAVLLSVGYTPEELEPLLKEKDLLKKFIKTGNQEIDEFVDRLCRIFSKLLGNSEFNNWIGKQDIVPVSGGNAENSGFLKLLNIIDKLFKNAKFTNLILKADENRDKLISGILRSAMTSNTPMLDVAKSISLAPITSLPLSAEIYGTGAVSVLKELQSVIKQLLPTTDMTMFAELKEEILKSPRISFSLFKTIYDKKGICDGEYFREWVEGKIHDKVNEIEGCKTNEYKHLTFGQLEVLRNKNPDKYKQLFIVGAEFDSHGKLNPIVYSAECVFLPCRSRIA